ncbi:hypothetical protein [Streptomyces phaeochromogenes]|uniref:hypothetical protein n=1 Tax=Streptomyces phaeochromogenes TaxID=1923 RepID=UPI0027D85401|nr:hypothetical protein [Streptomyces phaeochromogenes]
MGAHLSAVEALCVHPGTGGEGGRPAPHPGHGHKTDGHIDHAVGRPRTIVSADDTVLEPSSDALALPPAAAPDFVSEGNAVTILVEAEQGLFTQPRP